MINREVVKSVTAFIHKYAGEATVVPRATEDRLKLLFKTTLQG